MTTGDEASGLDTRQRALVADAAAAALGAPEPERAAVVRSRCAGDPLVEAEVFSILRHASLADAAGLLSGAVDLPRDLATGTHPTGSSTGDKPPPPPSPPTPPTPSWQPKPGDAISQYQLLSVIGEGTYGVVFLAEQPAIPRRVAIKILRTGLDSRAILSRFNAERATLARMDHANVARIYDAGETPAGLSYFVMEHVDGGPITAACDERRLGLRERLALLAQACDGVQHTHQRAVIHRDLKPGNILVKWDDDGPVVKVIDFGVAKALEGGGGGDRSIRTQQGELIGTLRYMSPEQCSGDPGAVDVRSDVYGLGAVLYELVCGRPAHDAEGLSPIESARRIVQIDPPSPRSIDPRLRRPVETIILKALAKDPRRRYQSAADLGTDIRRFLAGERILALPPSKLARLLRLATRHKLIATGAACLLLALLILLTTMAAIRWLALRPDHIAMGPAKRWVELRSRARHQLHLWDSDVKDGIWFAQLLERASAMGGGRIVVVAYSRETADPTLAGHLVTYRVDRPKEPLWSSADSVLVMPPGYADRRTAHLDVSHVRIADVLPDAPGPEIILVQALWPFSPNVVRIFDLTGKLRYRVWHEGGLLDLAGLKEPGRLLLCGINSECRWDERGADVPTMNYPMVVMGVEVRDGHVNDGWLVHSGRRLDETLRWYRWIGPANETLAKLAPIGAGFARTGNGFERSRFVELVVAGRPMGPTVDGGFSIVLDGDGVEAMRWTGDGYKKGETAGVLPPVESYRLLDYEDLPPPLPKP